ncbi:MAG: S9 family peptidase, partial [Pseudomonadales bacterium]|nr:S9 family peptidase [Pseudomonadales bacterium]
MIHDSRLLAPNMWGDKFEGVAGPSKDRKYPEELASNLKGKLLLGIGLLDYEFTASTLRIVEGLQRANMDFDLLIEPKLGHWLTNYQMRRSWDFLVRHLQG